MTRRWIARFVLSGWGAIVALALPGPLLAQQGITRSAAFSVDGRTIASSSTPVIDIWNVPDGRLLRRLEGHSEYVNALAFSPDGKVLASGSYDRTVRIWDARTGKELRVLKGPEKAIAFLAVSADSKTVAAGGYDKIIWLWDIATGNEIRKLAGSDGEILFLAFSPDGKTLASGGCESPIRLWDIDSGKEVRQLLGNRNNVRTFTFAPDSKTGYSGGCDHSVRAWEIATGKEIRQFAGHTNDVFFVTLSPDGKTLATGCQDGAVRLFNSATGDELRRCGDNPGDGHPGGVICVAFSPDGRTLTSGGYDKTQRIWETANGRQRLLFGGETEPVDLSKLPKPPNPTREELDKVVWQDLALQGGRRVHAAVWTLVQSPHAVAILKDRLSAPPPAAKVDEAKVKRLIEDLDNELFRVREKATADLAQMGAAVAPLLKAALAARPGPEPRNRLEKLLATLGDVDAESEAIREIRAVEVLEQIGNQDAVALLQTLSRGGEGERTRQAQAALARLARRK